MSTSAPEQPKHILPRLFPFYVAAAAFVVFIVTLNHWLTTRSAPLVALAAGWEWRPPTTAPVMYLLTLPFRALSGQPLYLGLNLLSAVCGALTIALLVRTVNLMPHDRTRDQRHRPVGEGFLLKVKFSWMPGLVAGLLCAFQLSFLENATVASGEIIDLLMFAYVVRCLFEYRASQRDSWLYRMAFVYGLAVTNNWAMIGFFPFFAVAILWLKWLRMFQPRFLLTILGCGLAGLLLYLLLPAIHMASGATDTSFLAALKANLQHQKAYMTALLPIYRYNARLIIMLLTSVFPLVLILIKWPSFSGDLNPAGTALTNWMFRLMHLLLLAFCGWVFFDPRFSPRELSYNIVPFLTFYYLASVVVGYCLGYFLILLVSVPYMKWERGSEMTLRLRKRMAPVLVALALGTTAALLIKNFPAIRATNSDLARRMAEESYAKLPTSPTIVLSDDAVAMYLVQAVESSRSKQARHAFVLTSALESRDYFDVLSRRYPQLFPAKSIPEQLDSWGLIQMLEKMSFQHPIYYLHPSFGFFFERFYTVPHGFVRELKIYPDGAIAAPALSAEVVAENEQFWTRMNPDQALPKKRELRELPAVATLALGLSRGVNGWGAELQKRGQWTEAGKRFDEATRINKDNVVAAVNAQFNKDLVEKKPLGVEPLADHQKKLQQFRTLEQALKANGPFDDLYFQFRLGIALAQGGNLRQSAHAFLRVLELKPDDVSSRINLARTYHDLTLADRTISEIERLKSEFGAKLSPAERVQILELEAITHYGRGDSNRAERVLVEATQKSPNDTMIPVALMRFYWTSQQYEKVLGLLEAQLKTDPTNATALLNKGSVHITMGQAPQAVETLNQFLQLRPQNTIGLMNRAIAHLRGGNLEAAKKDYETLDRLLPTKNFSVYYGLAEIAYQQKNVGEAIENYRLYLKHAPKGTEEYRRVSERLDELKRSKKIS